MKKLFKLVLLTAMTAVFSIGLASAQDDKQPAQWKYTVNEVGEGTYEIVFEAERRRCNSRRYCL